jgi:diguanylate cyclase (GGDEF)-like protein/putative nucleotidyltransferase with HDIG domain
MPFSQLFFWLVPIVALASYCLLMLFFTISQKDKFIRTFMLVLAALILWTASSLFMKMQLYPGVLFWNRLMVAGTIAVPFLLYCFVSVFTNSLNVVRTAIWGSLAVTAVIVDLLGFVVTKAGVITNTMTANGHLFTSVEFYYSLGIVAYPMYFLMFSMIIAILVKARKSVRNGNTTYGQIGLITAGISIMFLGSLLNVFPSIGKYPVDILACFINAILIMVSIYKYRMLELRFMVTRGIVYSVFAILLTGVYVYSVLFVEKTLGYSYRDILTYFTAFSALLVAVVFQPLYRLSCRLVDKMFYKAEYSQRQALRNFSLSISNNLDLNNIVRELIEAVQLALHAKQILVLIKHEAEEYYYVFRTSSQLYKPDFQISLDNPIVKWLISNNASLSRQELYSQPFFKSMWEKEKKDIHDLDIEVIIPIKSRNDIIGMLMLTRKNNNTAYTLDDLDLLTYLGASTAVAFDNARLFARSQSEAITDSLTKLYNHRYFFKALSEQVEKIGSAELSILLVDLDFFKLYNDLYGHVEGDKTLEMVASIMTRMVGQKGIVCRYGGEEFTILLPYHNSQMAYVVAEKIRLEIHRSFFNTTDVTQRFLTASIGVCTYPHAAPNGEELLKRADLAMYTAKNQGKNQTVIYTPRLVASETPYNASIEDTTDKPLYAATIYALTAAIDAKDHYTFGHSKKVAEYATILASKLSLDKSHIEIIREAALLHDIGKIGIPENILTKTGRLTTEEYSIVKQHVELSIAIIKHLPSLNHVIPAVLGHHERWDGNGYPRGLKGENISLAARCLSIADSFDAMTSNRPYRAILSVSAALSEIEHGIGTQFDPLIANLFIKLVSDGTIKVDQNVQTMNVG